MAVFDNLKDKIEDVAVMFGDKPSEQQALDILLSTEPSRVKQKRAWNVFAQSGIGGTANRWIRFVFACWHRLFGYGNMNESYEGFGRAWYEAYCANDKNGMELIYQMLACEYAEKNSFGENATRYLTDYAEPDSGEKMFAFEFYAASAYLYGWGVDADKQKAFTHLHNATELLKKADVVKEVKDYAQAGFDRLQKEIEE